MKKTVIISCAGKGVRLEKFIPKCLVEIENITLIERTIKLLKDEDEIIIVVGYKGEQVIEKVEMINKKYKANIKFVWNNDYETTGAGASFLLGAKEARNQFLIALVGDLIVNKEDMKKVLALEEEFACGEFINTENPVYMLVNNQNKIIRISKDEIKENELKTNYKILEWSGFAGIYKDHIKEKNGPIYSIVNELLPVKALLIRAREIDTPNDLNKAENWVKNNYID